MASEEGQQQEYDGGGGGGHYRRDSEFILERTSSRIARDTVKCVVVGDDRVGKTCMVATFGTGRFPTEHIPTVFEPFQVSRVHQGQTFLLTLHDTARQEDYDCLRVMTYGGADVVIVCFSIASRQSFLNIKRRWLPELKQHATHIPLILVGTKTDLRQDKKTEMKLKACGQTFISPVEGEKLARRIGASVYAECSALTDAQGLGAMFDKVFQTGVEDKLKRRKIINRKPTMYKMFIKKFLCFGVGKHSSSAKTNEHEPGQQEVQNPSTNDVTQS